MVLTRTIVVLIVGRLLVVWLVERLVWRLVGRLCLRRYLVRRLGVP